MSICGVCGSVIDGGTCPGCGAMASQAETLDGPPQPATPGPSVTALRPGSVLAHRYRVIERVGRGGMGEVYRAEDLELRETVALKLLPPELAADLHRREYLRQEVSLARRVSHANVCRVHDLGDADGLLFVSMEYIEGEDLASLLTRIGRLTAEKALAIARQVTAGLAAAHAAGVLHRDLKPANVMLDKKGNAHLTDFGLAVPGGEARPREIVGTPRYMAPEQLEGMQADERTDLYALGLLLYELVTGVPAYDGKSFEELRRVRETPPVPPTSLVRDLDRGIEDVILRCLARDPAARPASALAVLTALSHNDPMQAALAAGQTPSPSAVADAVGSGALKPAIAWGCAALIAVTFVMYHGGGAQRLSVVEGSRLELPPDALAVRAREVLATLGYPDRFAHEAWGFTYNRAALNYLNSHGGWDALAAARPAAIVFWYRGAPEPLSAPLWTGRIRENLPAPSPGSVSLRLDPRGRLVRLTFQPRHGEGPKPQVNPEALFPLVGLEQEQVHLTEPKEPPVFSDRLVGWSTEGGIRLDAAFLAGRPVYASLGGPWDEIPKRGPRDLTGNDALTVVALLISIFLGWANLKRGRSDLQGALRIAAVLSLLVLGARLLESDSAAVFLREDVLLAALFRALAAGAATWLFYVALEPHVRRAWPQRLVSWTRLLDGRWRDPMVARDVLIGATVAYASAAVVIIGFVTAPGTRPINQVLYGLDPLLGNRFALAAALYAGVDAISMGLLSLVLLLVLRLVPGPPWLSSGLLAILLSAATFGWLLTTTHHAAAFVVVLSLVVGVSWTLVLARFGLLAMITGMFLELFASNLPNVMTLSGWMAPAAWAPLLVGCALTLYGVLFSTGRVAFLGYREQRRPA